jgi:predicted Zn finger-like uncharacterized protein
LSESDQATCPHCHTSFLLGQEQRVQAAGRVRCGKCLQVFNANTGEAEFIAPRLPQENASHPLAEFSVKPMTAADFPAPAYKVSKPALLLLVLLLVTLLAQAFLWQTKVHSPQDSLQIEQLVVRRHPEREGALRLDAILSNRGQTATALPALDLMFSTRYGEPRAQRLFMPSEYLHGDYRDNREITANTEIQISLSLQDPGHDAINFYAQLRSVMNSSN